MSEETIESNELYEHFRFVADKGQAPLRIDKFLINKLEGTSRNRIQAAAAAGNILVNEKAVKSNYRVKPLDTITIVLPHPPIKFELIPEDIPLNIVYEDHQLLVINKAPGMVVHPGHGNYTGTMVNALMHHLKDNPLFQSGQERPGLVHRIDKNTSGLLVVAKTENAMTNLALQFFNKTTKRTYMGLVWGNINEDEGTITGYLGRNPKDRKKIMVIQDGSGGKHSVTHYRVIERLGYVTLVECKLETGRTHQIRVHFQHLKHPLFGDIEYGGDKILRGTTFSNYRQFVNNCFKILPRQALHASSLGFCHPEKGDEMLFTSELPGDMNTVIEKWRNYISRRNT
ncbi:MAG: RluA family pseudouridine synthase [Bacteroidales bacterium]|nr:RluA family pseudouridine synthase [Bacteroidales bacterium]